VTYSAQTRDRQYPKKGHIAKTRDRWCYKQVTNTVDTRDATLKQVTNSAQTSDRRYANKVHIAETSDTHSTQTSDGQR